MNQNNKNISAIIIIICILSVLTGIFLPKGKSQHKNAIQAKYEDSSYFSLSPISVGEHFKQDRISIIKLEGIINDSPGSSIFKDLTSSNSALELITKATKDSSIKGIVLRINSPGGTVAASQELYKAIINAKKKKPVVISFGDIAASGGYYIASAGDVIFANPGTLTGSIGVITSYLNFYDLLNKIGVKGVVIKSGEFKDIGNPTRPLTEQERKILQALLDDSYDQFLTDVSHGRNIPKKKVAELAKGLIYTGKQAKKIGLVDYIGDYYKAIKYTQKIVKERFPILAKKYGKKDIPLEETWKNTSIVDVFLGATSKLSKPTAMEEKIFKPFVYSRFQPLWLLE